MRALALTRGDTDYVPMVSLYGQCSANEPLSLRTGTLTHRPESVGSIQCPDHKWRRLRRGLVRPTRCPRLYRNLRPAWNDSNLLDLCEHVQSHMFLAHVRAATSTPVPRPLLKKAVGTSVGSGGSGSRIETCDTYRQKVMLQPGTRLREFEGNKSYDEGQRHDLVGGRLLIG